MTQLITGKIDLAKIHGAKVLKKDGRTFVEVTASALFEGKTGALYLDVTLWPSTNDQYGNDYRINQDLPRALRDGGAKGAILGNGKNKTLGGGPAAPAPRTTAAQASSDDSSDVPF